MATIRLPSSVDSLLSLPAEQRTAWIDSLTETERTGLSRLLYDWRLFARPAQLPPEVWLSGERPIWLIRTGRAWGKTRTGAETVRSLVESGAYQRIGLIERTPSDARDTMIEGVAGLLSVHPPWSRPLYEPAKRRLTWPATGAWAGAQASIYTAAEPDAIRGANLDLIWAEELASWKAPETWSNAKLALRYGPRPLALVTTTPKPSPLILALGRDPSVITTTGSTYDNRAHLPEVFLRDFVARLEGTRLGRQEVHGEVMEEDPSALWTRALLDETRVATAPALSRIVVGLDPSASSGEQAAEAGIIIVGLGVDGEGYVLGDSTTHGAPAKWGAAAVSAWSVSRAERIVAEKNNGGEMVSAVLRSIDPRVPVKLVHASDSKQARAQPISTLFEMRRAHLVGHLAELEDQLCTWVPEPGARSPDRLDAMVWALTELLLPRYRFGWDELYAPGG